MANNTYLYPSDGDPYDENLWTIVGRRYCYAGRECIPLSWFFFFRPSDLFMLDFFRGTCHWQEPRLVTPKVPAIALFLSRKSLLVQATTASDEQIESIESLVSALSTWPGESLWLDPSSVAQDDDNLVFEALATLLKMIEDLSSTGRDIAEFASTSCYCSSAWPIADLTKLTGTEWGPMEWIEH